MKFLKKNGNWLKSKITESINMLDQYRIEEGNSIMADLKKCIGNILSMLQTVGTFEQGRIIKVREKLLITS